MKRRNTENDGTQNPRQKPMTEKEAIVLYHQMSLYQKLQYGASFGIPTALLLEIFGAQGGGLALAFFVALATGYFSEELKAGIFDKLPRRKDGGTEKIRKWRWWLTGEDTRSTQTIEPEQNTSQQPTQQASGAENQLSEIDQLFQAERNKQEAPGIQRLMPNDIIRNTPPDEYRICIGRSLTREGNPPIWINMYGQHLKLIGASQYGKSSMAAFLLYVITRTHKPSNVLIALLDMEHKTSKLFTDCQHLADVNINGKWVTLHAKTREQVLEHLGHVVTLMDGRYTLTEEEVEQEPILLVYLEEFLALKDYFKRLVDSLTGEAKEAAKKDYAQLVFRVSEIARRGLKVKVQLLLCAQVDYRDDDFQEALVNITGGMSFCVRASAAQAAGFVRTDLLKRNVKDDKKGQAVVETPDCKDLVLAPEYNLKKKLLAFEQARNAQYPKNSYGRTSLIAPTNTRKIVDSELESQPPDEEQQFLFPATPTEENQRKLTSLHRRAIEHYQPGMGYRQLGELIGVGKDKAGDLIKELKKWGFLKEEGTDE